MLSETITNNTRKKPLQFVFLAADDNPQGIKTMVVAETVFGTVGAAFMVVGALRALFGLSLFWVLAYAAFGNPRCCSTHGTSEGSCCD